MTSYTRLCRPVGRRFPDRRPARAFAAALAASLVTAGLVACAPSPQALTIGGPVMGTSYSIRVVAPRGSVDSDALRAAVEERLEELNQRLSTYLDDSDVSRFNRSDSTDWFPVTPDTAVVVARSLEISRATDGAFDVTVAPLVNLWGFGPEARPPEPPPAADLERLRASAGHERLEASLSPPALRKHLPGLWVDLSAIAKGYAVDEIAQLLDRFGLDRYMVEIGGEIRTRGAREDGGPWRIALERPTPGTREVLRVLELSGESVASSGDYRNFFELDGRRYSHTIDPRTGWPVRHALGAVSVVAEDCMTADAWATGLLVLGPDDGLEAARRAGLAANLVERSGDRYVEHMTPAFEALQRGGPGAVR